MERLVDSKIETENQLSLFIKHTHYVHCTTDDLRRMYHCSAVRIRVRSDATLFPTYCIAFQIFVVDRGINFKVDRQVDHNK